MKYTISILCPGIRNHNWKRLYDSISEATRESWEIVFVGPYPLPDELQDKSNITYIQDFGSPIRCQQIALVHSNAKYINWAADDGYFLIDSLDIGLSLVGGKNIVMQKYQEGSEDTTIFKKEEYYLLSKHNATQTKYIPSHYFGLNVGIVERDILFDIGGWDCEFEACPMSHADLSVRLQALGHEFTIQEEIAFTCSHMPGVSGDHGPIHYAQITHDEPLFKAKYSVPITIENLKIDINNWEKADKIWTRRFV